MQKEESFIIQHSTSTDIHIITSELFSRYPELIFAMSTRKGGVSPSPLGMNLSFNVGDDRNNVERNRKLFFDSQHVGLDRLTFTQQVHGDIVITAHTPGAYEHCDALMTNERDLYLTISVADCVPVFLYDPMTNSVAAVHSGWRGTKSMIVSKAVKLLREKFNANAKDLLAFIGPSAGVCCYEVGKEVANEFGQQYVHNISGGKIALDLKSANSDLLLVGGVKQENIEVSPYCTICTSELFHSFRRDGARSGRMLGVIGLRRSKSDS